jgi:nitric oxide reductase subunit C
MLSKSQAKAFFLIGTLGFSAVFVGLTIDTFSRIPTQTHSENLTESAIRGKHLFDKKNCMGCHTIMGEGAYYAPELTKVIDRRGEGFVKQMLKDPQAMYPGQRKMTNYKLTDQEIADLTAFLKWVGEMDLNGFPPKPDLMPTAQVESLSKPQVFNQTCTACHSVNGQGGQVGPALDDIGRKFDQDYLARWLKNPMSIKPDSKMPKLPLTEKEIEELTLYLSGLKGE